MRRVAGWRRLFFLPLALYGAVYLLHWPFRTATDRPAFERIAHRGVHQTYHRRDLDNATCTASRIDPPRHAFLENSLPSMQAAFAAGATMVEIDVHSTADGNLVVWHDWTLECRTEARGETRRMTLAQLKALDAGYGYSADGGQSFPFRGKGVGLIVSLPEVLSAFPQQPFLINQKDRSPATTRRIAAALDAANGPARNCLMATPELNSYFLDLPQATVPRCTMAGRAEIKACLIDYLKTGWTGSLPASCAGQRLIVPDSALVRLLWGWPGTFIDRIRRSGGRVYVWTDDPTRLAALQDLRVDGIVTDRIELMAPER